MPSNLGHTQYRKVMAWKAPKPCLPLSYGRSSYPEKPMGTCTMGRDAEGGASRTQDWGDASPHGREVSAKRHKKRTLNRPHRTLV